MISFFSLAEIKAHIWNKPRLNRYPTPPTLAYHSVMDQIDPNKLIYCFHVQVCLWTVFQHFTGTFLVQCDQGRLRQHFPGNSPKKGWRVLWADIAQVIFLRNVVTTHLDNFGVTIFLFNARTLIAQDFYLWVVVSRVLRQYWIGFFLMRCCLEPQG